MAKLDFTYKFVELRDEINNSIAQLEKAVVKTQRLNEILEPYKEEFDDVILGNNNAVDQYRIQITALTAKAAGLDKVIKYCNENKRISESIAMLMIALGIFKLPTDVEETEEEPIETKEVA